MKPYHVFRGISPRTYKEIKDLIRADFEIQVSEGTMPGLEERFEVLGESVKVHYYKTGKLLFQSSPANRAYARLVSEISRKFSLGLPGMEAEVPTRIPQNAKCHVGCDEAGAGEAFGSIFLGCVAVTGTENLKGLEQVFDDPDVKGFGEHDILEKYERIKRYCRIFVKRCEAPEVDRVNKNVLLDQRYEELLWEAISEEESTCVIVDDYGIGRGLKSFLEGLKSRGHFGIVEARADEKYAVCQAASVAARKCRLEEIRDLNREFCIEDEDGKTVCPGSGNAGNPQTARYLESFVRTYPSRELPPFVRRKWGNVRKFMQERDGQRISQYFGNESARKEQS